MGEMIKLGVVLMLVALIAAVALGLVNSQTAPIIAVQQEMAKQEAMSLVALNLVQDGDSLAFDSIAVEGLENPYASADELLSVVRVTNDAHPEGIGFVFVAYGKGYSSTIQTMVAVDSDGIIAGTTILYQSETPGLGANIEQPARLITHLDGLDAPDCMLTKDGGRIDSMTGCTITSRAVVNSIREGLEAMESAGLFDDAGMVGWQVDPPPEQDESIEEAPAASDSTMEETPDVGAVSEGGSL